MAQVLSGTTVLADYAYNGKGEQVLRIDGGGPVHFVYDEAGHLLGQYDSASHAIQEYLWLDDLPVGVVTGGQVYYVEPDHLGTPRAVIDPVRQKAVWAWPLTGEAFGATAPNQDADGDGIAFTLDLRFPGQRYDAVSGLNYNYFRDYEPGTGRYVESDPAGIVDGPSTYAYAKHNPLRLLDSVGKSARPGPGYSFESHKELARSEALAKIQQCVLNDCEETSDPYPISESLRTAVIDKLWAVDIALDVGESNCGATVPNLNRNEIVVGGKAFSGVCCPMASILAHEAVHLVSLDPHSIKTEGQARKLQLRCFGCATAFH